MLLLLRAFSLGMNIYIYMLPCVLDGVSIDRFDEHELVNLAIVICHFNLNQQIKTRRIHMPFKKKKKNYNKTVIRSSLL